ncbi:MAG TPA: sulfotransferase [Chitinophagaceae bacterium]|jgi:hypothetical protein
MSKVLIIAGMHRSGTSLITQWLHRCGLFVGKTLAGPDIGNDQGFFEDTDFQDVHKQLLRKRHCSPIGFEDKPFPELDANEKRELLSIIEKKESEQTEWGWKDPITCLFLDAYRELVPSAFYLVIVRDFRSTVSSLVTREHKVDMKRFQTKKGLSRLKWKLFKRKKIMRPFEFYSEMFLRVWIHYYEEIFDHVRSLPESQYLFINYSQLLENDRWLFDRLKNEWSFSLDYFPFSKVYKKDLISEVESFEQYIHDKELLARAKKIEMEYNRYLHRRQKVA